ncbi:MAG: alpha-L-rhamnosidase, partial [Acidobacteria bacterium]|nr:alpha-L-rhamnosidase [Acidobacteriota bacterium]
MKELVGLGRTLAVVCFLIAGAGPARAALAVQNLHVEYRTTPLGIDVREPRFGWQLHATAGERGVTQTAYRLEVRDPGGTLAWDSKKVESAESLGITYLGAPLQASTRYTWTVTVWTGAGEELTASSWFETGLMDSKPGAPAWGGAEWIGGGDEDLVLYSPYLGIFHASYRVAIAPGSTSASFVYGANDSRLMDRYKNVSQLENARDHSYIKLELDVSRVDGSRDGKARLHVYRAGYTLTDDPARPFKTFEIDTALVHQANKHAEHAVAFRSTFGQIWLSIDGSTAFAGASATAPQGAAGWPGRGTAPN